MKNSLRHSRLISVMFLASMLPFISSAAQSHCGIQGRTHVYTGLIFIGQPPLVIPAVVTLFPVATTFTVVSVRSGRVVAYGNSDSEGNFKIPLPPGKYVVVPDEISDTRFCSYSTPEPFEVTVEPRAFTGAGFTYIADCRRIFVGLPVF